MTEVTFTELTGGAGVHLLSAQPGPDLAAHGYVESEYAARGITRRFVADPDNAGPITEDGSAEFVTRIVVRRPADPAAFNGCVVAEWLNVSGGADTAPEYTYLAEELVRGGYAWVGVSAQYTGVMGGTDSVDLATTGTMDAAGDDAPSGAEQVGTGKALGAVDPARYASLSHPGDAYCYDIFGLIGASLGTTPRTDVAAAGRPLDGLAVRHLLAVGESQAAMALTTYVNRFAHLHNAFDGMLIHSRAVGELPLGEFGGPVDITRAYRSEPVRLRDDATAEVIVVQTETDVLGDLDYFRARQPDTERLRIWEVAGTSHADRFQIGEYEELLGCPLPVNRGQQRFVLRAALRHLRAWVAEGTPPPAAPPLEVDAAADGPRYVVDDAGNVRGGVRTPCVDAPTQTLSGLVDGTGVSRICVLFGSTTAAPPDALARRYRDADDYLARYRVATDAAIDAGFVLADDRDHVLDDARPDLVPNQRPRSEEVKQYNGIRP
ncbi:alpha/beta hydrolase domain-containing protein [Gordonia sinesedis]